MISVEVAILAADVVTLTIFALALMTMHRATGPLDQPGYLVLHVLGTGLYVVPPFVRYREYLNPSLYLIHGMSGVSSLEATVLQSEVVNRLFSSFIPQGTYAIIPKFSTLPP
ncbi:hypothetical protein J3R82DRAFT_3252 [Butyriboletus roseoflavus]|nr:hypothetical protein J3R82DRAFT_3252 [Butyriboletus roseoflavus]